jgi:hypothetical protein
MCKQLHYAPTARTLVQYPLARIRLLVWSFVFRQTLQPVPGCGVPKPCARPVRASSKTACSAASARYASRTHHTILLVLVCNSRSFLPCSLQLVLLHSKNPVLTGTGHNKWQIADSHLTPTTNNRLIYVSMTFQMCWVGETYVADWLHMAVLACCTNPCKPVPHGGYHIHCTTGACQLPIQLA